MLYKATGLVTGWHGYCRVSVSVAKDGPSEAEAGTHLAFGVGDLLPGGRVGASRAGDLYKAMGLVTSGAICSSRRRLC